MRERVNYIIGTGMYYAFYDLFCLIDQIIQFDIPNHYIVTHYAKNVWNFLISDLSSRKVELI